MSRFLFIIALMPIVLMTTVAAQTKAEIAKNKENQVRTNIENRSYTIGIDYAFPSNGRSISVTSNYSVKITADSVYSYLPYFGRAYSIPYGGGEGLIFDGPTKDYTIGYGKRGEANIMFSIRTKEDVYVYTLKIFPNGSSSLYVQPNNKQAISFGGYMKLKN